jgi:hypothetical protein
MSFTRRRDDCQLPFFAALCDELFGGISCNHASAQDNDEKSLHGFGLELVFLRSEPLFLPPPVSLFTMAQARASAVFVLNPFFS